MRKDFKTIMTRLIYIIHAERDARFGCMYHVVVVMCFFSVCTVVVSSGDM